MELSINGIGLNEIGYWSAVVAKGLEDQGRLIKRAEPLIKKMGQDEFTAHKRSGYKKIFRALSEASIEPLRELKTLEKGVIVKDLENTRDVFISLLPGYYSPRAALVSK